MHCNGNGPPLCLLCGFDPSCTEEAGDVLPSPSRRAVYTTVYPDLRNRAGPWQQLLPGYSTGRRVPYRSKYMGVIWKPENLAISSSLAFSGKEPMRVKEIPFRPALPVLPIRWM